MRYPDKLEKPVSNIGYLLLTEAETRDEEGEEESEDEEDDTLISRLFEELEAMRQRVSTSLAYILYPSRLTCQFLH